MKIAVYSGSFNPLHIGHKAIMKYLTDEGRFDKVYLVVSPKNPLKNTVDESSAKIRFENAVKILKKYPELKVLADDIELGMSPPYYTIKTLDALKAREPENDFTLVMGADNLSCIREWKHFPRLLTDYGVIVYPRKGFDIQTLKKALIKEYISSPEPYVLDASFYPGETGMNTLEDILSTAYNIRLITAPLIDVSSTEIREAMDLGKNVSELLM